MKSFVIQSINIASASKLEFGGRSFLTGIAKQPQSSAVNVTQHGLAGDVICDTKHHGGPDQAVYAYSADDYAWWANEHGLATRPGLFGENLTIAGLPSDLRIGDRLLIGSVILEATSPRIPCSTLAARLKDSGFGLKFREAERPGVYFRVLRAGSILAGDAAILDEQAASEVTMLELYRLAYSARPAAAELERALSAPIAERMKTKFRAKLAALV